MTVDLNSFVVKSADDFLQDMITFYRNGLIRRGIPNPIVAPGTDDYIRFQSLANQLAILANNAALKANAQMPDSAVGADLDRCALDFGLVRNPAGGSDGPFVVGITNGGSVLIPADAQLIDPRGLLYAVSAGSSYEDGDEIPIESLDTGSATNLEEGTILTWLTPIAFVKDKGSIGVGGLTGGVDAENDEDLRARLLARLQNAPGSGNWSQVADLAVSAETGIQAAFIYPTINGASTMGVAVVRSPTETNKGRDVEALVLATVDSVLTGGLPQYVSTIVTTVTNVDSDVCIGLSLPASTKAVPAGPGGGWLDGVVFPQDPDVGYAQVVGVVSSTEFTVRSGVSPQGAGISHITWLSPYDWKIYRATVLSYVVGSPPTYTITLDTPFVGISIGDVISPDAENIDDYYQSVLDSFGRMGPGEKLDPTEVAGVFPRAYRKPLPSQSYPSNVNQKMLAALNDLDNVDDSEFLYRSQIAPDAPNLVTDAPQILVPRRISFLPQS